MKALDHVTVLDLSRVAAGPLGTQTLADLGARVWKVESLKGDDTRTWGPTTASGNSEGPYFTAVNRGKQGLAINFKDPRGQALIKGLAQHADVLVENYKVGDLARHGLGYGDLAPLNPRLIYVSLTGYGQGGPRASQLGYDTVLQALTGIMTLTGDADRPPAKVGVAWIDVMSGLTCAVSVLAALAARDKSGQGQHVDLSLFDVGLMALLDAGQDYLQNGNVQVRSGSVHRNFAPSQPFEAADGWLIMAIANEDQYRRFCAMIARDDLAADPRFTDNRKRLQHRDALAAEVAAEIAKRTRAEWIELGVRNKVPINPIHSVADALGDGQAQARGSVWNLPRAGDVPLPVIASPLRHMSATPAAPSSPPPGLGQHTSAVLQEVLKLGADEIAALKADGVIHCP